MKHKDLIFLNDSFVKLLLNGTQIDNSKDILDFQFTEIKNFEEFNNYQKQMEPIYYKRQQFEKYLSINNQPFTIQGYNSLIEKNVNYKIDFNSSYYNIDGIKIPNFRETCICSKTFLNNRMRGSLYVIKAKGFWKKLCKGTVYITEQTTPYYNYLYSLNKKITGSEFFGNLIPLGSKKNGIRNEDITQFTFQNETFDLLLTYDVLEHVTDYKKAYKEIHRVLKKKGIVFLTVPFHTNQYKHTIRSIIDSSGKIEHILPPEYHGDPVKPNEGILCFQVFGWNLLDELRDIGFRDAGVVFYWSFFHGFLGKEQMVIYAEK